MRPTRPSPPEPPRPPRRGASKLYDSVVVQLEREADTLLSRQADGWELFHRKVRGDCVTLHLRKSKGA